MFLHLESTLKLLLDFGCSVSLVFFFFYLKKVLYGVHEITFVLKLSTVSKSVRYLATSFLPSGLLVPVEDDRPTLLILGVLLTLRYLIPLLQQQVKDTSLKGSFGVTRKETEISPSPEQLIQVKYE